ncbi:MAG: DNA primase [Bacteroidales bacterium]|nr:DNA primase [Bacteroidales bacterium]
MIKREDIEKIINAARIEEVVGSFVELRKRGVNYIGLCPFHNEKTPSFNVNPAKGIFKCFGCGEGGDSVAFLMKHEHYTYPEALRWLANKYGIQIEEQVLTQEEIAQQSERDRIYQINDFAQKYFQEILFSDIEGKSVGLSYLKERELEEDTIKRWGIGYCKETGDDFSKKALAKGFTKEELVNAGLSLVNSNDGSLYDRFRGRVCFPIYNIGGRVLGFSARTLRTDKVKAKYVNSPESLIYSKGKVLFGLHLAKNEIVKQDECFLVEGNMDVVMMSQNAVTNVVATSGTALTEDQIRLIKRYTKNVTLLYDGDKAGIKATFKAVNLLLEQGLHVKTLLFPDNEDPDSFARKHTQDEFKDFIKTNAQNFIIYKTNLLLAEAQNDPIKRADLTRDIVETIALIPDLLERNAYLQQCSKLLAVKEEILGAELAKILRNKATKEAFKQNVVVEETPQANEPIPSTPIVRTDNDVEYNKEKAIISVLFNYADKITTQELFNAEGKKEKRDLYVANYIVCDIFNDNIGFNFELFNEIFMIYKDCIYNTDYLPELRFFTSHQNPEISKLAIDLVSTPYVISPNWEEKNEIKVPRPENKETMDKYVRDTLLDFKLYKINGYIEDVKKRIPLEEGEFQLELLNLLKSYLEIRNNIAKLLGRVFIP